MPKWAIALGIGILVVGLFFSYVGLGPRPDDQTQITSLIGDCQTAANAHDWGRVLSHVAADYHDSHGFTKDKLRALALEASRLEPFHCETSIGGITISDKLRATALVHVTISHDQTKSGPYDVLVVLEKRGNWWQQLRGRGWIITSADGWQGALDAEGLSP